MKKFFKLLIVFFLCNILLFYNYSPTLASTTKVTVHTDSRVVGQFYYENKVISIRRITAGTMPTFCMNINLDYPMGESFEFTEAQSNPIIEHILSISYPNTDLSNLGVNYDDDGYFITQTILWCYIHDFDINKVYCDNHILEKAIHKLYEDIKLAPETAVGKFHIFKTTSTSVQPVILALPTSSLNQGIGGPTDSMNNSNEGMLIGK